MPPSTPPLRRIGLAALLTLCSAGPGRAADTGEATPQAAVQMLADVTLIDGECRGVVVNFGRAFQAGQSQGLRAGDIMPTGRLRPAFEAAYAQRLAQTPHDELCGALAKLYASEVPGLFTTP